MQANLADLFLPLLCVCVFFSMDIILRIIWFAIIYLWFSINFSALCIEHKCKHGDESPEKK